MRIIKQALIFVFLLGNLVIFTSCGSLIKMHTPPSGFNGGTQSKPAENFLIKKDSSYVFFDKMKLKTPLFSKNKFVLDNDTVVLAKEVTGYQNNGVYYAYIVGTGYTQRYHLGAISYYRAYKQESTYSAPTATNRGGFRNRTVVYNYIQKQNGQIVYYSPSNLLDMVQDNESSLEIMNDYFSTKKKLKQKAVINTLAGIAGFILAGSGKAGVHNYVGLAVMTGSITYGFFNRPKKWRNNRKLMVAFEDYNNSVPSIIK